MTFVTVKVSKRKVDTKKIKEGTVRVGWFSNVRYSDGVSVAQVARWNEFGTWNIPARPFMTKVAHKAKGGFVSQLKSNYAIALRNNEDTMKVLDFAGAEMRNNIQEQIDMTLSPRNSPVTIYGGWITTKTGKHIKIEGKGFDKPLYDTGFMYNSVTWQTEEVFK